jgi:hypothetical protein
MKIAILSILMMALAMTGCYRDNEEQLYPGNGSCDTIGVTYSTTVISLLQSNGCTGCHSASGASGGIALDNYTSVRTVAIGFSPMPKNGTKMSACNISKIKAWIDAGAINN